MTHQTDRLEAAVYNALRDFQQTADWPQLRLAQMRHHLAEHIARDLTLTPGALPATPDGISARDLAHALDNSTPYPVELTSTVAGFMAERLLEMLTISKRDEHPVWQPEEQPEPGPHPQPEDPATLTEADPAAVSAAVAPPTNRAAVLREAADRIDNEELPHDYVDMFDNGARWAARLLRRMADETATETPAVDLPTLAAALDGLHTLIATSSRDWGTYRVDAWLWAVLCGWDCEETEHDDTCVHGSLEEMASRHGWDDEAVAKARRYRAAVRAVTEHQPAAGARQDGGRP